MKSENPNRHPDKSTSRRIYILAALCLLCLSAQTQQFPNELFIPDTLRGSTITLNVAQSTTEFQPGIQTPTLGYNGSYLGPTLIFKKGEIQNITVNNTLNEGTTVHWHGMKVPAIYDGGPHSLIDAATSWNPNFEIRDDAATMWYHSHLHSQSLRQVNEGLAGMIIIRDDVESGFSLPRKYGVDDIPLIIQDKSFDSIGAIKNEAVLGDTFMINGVLSPHTSVPAQMVRFRLLNASIQRNYNFGFSDNRSFNVIATDGGLLEASISLNRFALAAGERMEIVVDFLQDGGDSLFLVNYASEMPYGIQGGIPGGDIYPSPLNGIDKEILKINVTGMTTPFIDSIPFAFTLHSKPQIADAKIQRYKELGGRPIQGVIKWTINGLQFNMNRMDDTVFSGSTEIWEIRNATHFAHPFHIHSGHFYVIENDSMPPPAIELGKKDVILVKPNTTVKFIMNFEDFNDPNVPYMYHCHMLDHEDDGMMAQFLLTDSSILQGEEDINPVKIKLTPNPADQWIQVELPEGLGKTSIQIFSMEGKILVEEENAKFIDISHLPSGIYVVTVNSKSNSYSQKIILK